MAEEAAKNNLNDDGSHPDLIEAFTDITSTTKEAAQFFLESHNFDLDSAITTFFETTSADPSTASPTRRRRRRSRSRSPSRSSDSQSPSFSPSDSPSRSRSTSPTPSLGLRRQATGANPYNLRSRNSAADKKPSGSRSSGRIRTFSDLNRRDNDSGSDSDEPQGYYTGGERSGMLVQDPSKANDVEELFKQAKEAGAREGTLHQHQPSSSSRRFTGRGRLLSGESVSAAPQQPEQTHTITFWTNGFTVDDGPLRRLDDPENAPFLESIRKSECPEELSPSAGRTILLNLTRKLEEYPVQKQSQNPFRGVGRTLGNISSEDATASASAPGPVPAASLNDAPTPSVGLVVDDELPSTSIQLRLSDGTRMVSRFNYHHTINDIRSFIDASRPGAPRSYQLQTMGFPPKQLSDLNETIEHAGIANSVVIQKL